MFRTLSDVLNGDELAVIHALLPQVRFADGRVTNPDSTIKHNLQAPQEDPASARISQIVRDALFRHPDVRTWAMPRAMARPTVVRYEPGMTYGWHVDEGLFPSTPPLRSDLSCTVFLNPPDDYDGGELMMQLGQETLAYRLQPGHAILYPSTTIHQVSPVTRGLRFAVITWMQSWVSSSEQRELLVQLEEARARAGVQDERLTVLLGSLRSNLFRMWADT